jgi:glycosyltransferase involved in cell wall biosynthesis
MIMQADTQAPLVTVYIPTRNRRHLLQRAVESVLAQSYPQLDVIVVNDCSNDDTAAYLNALATRDARLRVFHEPTPGGAPRARNKAILAARGELITGLDDDDWFKPTRIERFVQAFAEHQRRGSQFSCLFSDDECTDGAFSRIARKPDLVRAEQLYFFNLIGNQVFTRTALLREAGLFDPEMPAWQDLDLFIRLLRHAGPALRVDSPSYVLNLERRHDRISIGSKERIRAAYARLCDKTPELSPALRQGLYLQVFGDLYGHRFDGSDALELLRHGLHRRTLRTFGGLMLRQLRRAWAGGAAPAPDAPQRSFQPARP